MWLALALLTAALPASPQEANPRCLDRAFQDHQYVNLETLTHRGDLFNGHCVRTKGRLDLRGLRGPGRQQDAVSGVWGHEIKDPETGRSVCIKPAGEVGERFGEGQLALVGRMIEIAGTFSTGPPACIHFTGYEVVPERTVRRPDEILSPCDLVGSGDAYVGQRVVVWAPYRGRNVFRDLPDESRPDAAAWVVGDADCAVWITGHAPSGKGFSFDAPPVAVRWLKVEGKMERRSEAVVLKASKVMLAGPRH